MRAPERAELVSPGPCLDPRGSRPWRQKVPGNANKAGGPHTDRGLKAGLLEAWGLGGALTWAQSGLG